jgi:hypothetical protein
MPRTVQAAGGLYRLKGRITTPDVLTAHFEFDESPVTWTHRIFGQAEVSPETSNGMSFYGEKETIFLTDERYVVIPTAPGAQLSPPAGAGDRRTVEAKNDQQTEHVAEWLDAVRTRGKVSCPPEEAYRSTAAVQLAMVALKSGGRVDWDEATEQVRDNPKAAAILKREYRSPGSTRERLIRRGTPRPPCNARLFLLLLPWGGTGLQEDHEASSAVARQGRGARRPAASAAEGPVSCRSATRT